MSRYWLVAMGFVGFFLLGMAYGMLLFQQRFWPYEQVRDLYRSTHRLLTGTMGQWAIGIYTGDSPFQQAPANAGAPVLTAADVTDRRAIAVADPFLLQQEGRFSMFFEVLDSTTGQGDIGYASSDDGLSWVYGRIVLDEPFHLSYPQVFRWGEHIFLVPESHEDLSVRLYRARRFPDQWEFMGKLLSGFHYTDPTVFRHDGRWWMFVSNVDSDVLNLFYAEHLQGPWVAHPQNPVVRFDPHHARPGGRVFTFDGGLYRLAQDDYPAYGTRVWAFRILELGPQRYREQRLPSPLLAPGRQAWNRHGMHHMDTHKVGDTWLSAVDGRSR